MQDPFLTCQDPTPVIQHDELASTNTEAGRLIARGEQGPLWITAKSQTAGRGRNGRSWLPASGNLYASFVVTLWCEPQEVGQLSILAGAALAKAVATLHAKDTETAAAPSLKWPNDLMFDQAKAGGILVETTRHASGALSCIIGMGVNILEAPAIEDRPAISLAAAGYAPIPPEALLGRIDQQLRTGFAQLARHDGFSEIKTQWLSHAIPIGSPISVKAAGRRYEGAFAGIGEDGALLLKQGDRQITLTFGDVSQPPAVL